MAVAGAAVKLRRLRQRFGISAPKLSIKTHVAWYWRVLAAIAVLSVSLALAAWIYDAGRQIAGFHSRESGREMQMLVERLVELESEVGKLRGIAGSAESALKIERTTQQQLSQQIRILESENANLKQDLAFFEGVIPSSQTGSEVSVRINRLRIEPESAAGRYRYRMLVVHNGGRQAKEFRGTLQLLVKLQQEGKGAMITVPPENEQSPPGFLLEVRHFQRVEGVFSVPAGAVVTGVEVRLVQNGTVRARQSVTL